MEKLKIKEAIVVEGRDDTAVLKQVTDALIIETHGFGIAKTTWELLEKAYKEKGLIILTDPDFSGEEIRKKIVKNFPESKHAYMPRKKATKKGDIGIENASPEDVKKVLEKVCTVKSDGQDIFSDALNIAGLAVDYKVKFEEYDISHIILYQNSKLAMVLENDSDYERIYYEDNFKIFKRLTDSDKAVKAQEKVLEATK